MEKMDIQAESRNTAEARKLVEKERARADEAERLFSRSIINLYQKLGVSREDSIRKLAAECKMEGSRAQSLVDLYWPLT